MKTKLEVVKYFLRKILCPAEEKLLKKINFLSSSITKIRHENFILVGKLSDAKEDLIFYKSRLEASELLIKNTACLHIDLIDAEMVLNATEANNDLRRSSKTQ